MNITYLCISANILHWRLHLFCILMKYYCKLYDFTKDFRIITRFWHHFSNILCDCTKRLSNLTESNHFKNFAKLTLSIAKHYKANAYILGLVEKHLILFAKNYKENAIFFNWSLKLVFLNAKILQKTMWKWIKIKCLFWKRERHKEFHQNKNILDILWKSEVWDIRLHWHGS